MSSVLVRSSLALLLGCVLTSSVRAEDGRHAPSLNEGPFREKVGALERQLEPAGQTREVESLLKECWFSSQQVKDIATVIHTEEARYDFVLAAYPRTVDPENFYAVYDVFTNFSKAFRLHDQVQELRAAAAPPRVQSGFQPVTDEAMADILKTVRNGSFDNTKLGLARQILAVKHRFLSRQIAELVKVFDFDNTRLEVAKAGYDAAIDPENYLVVANEFSFSNTKDSLAEYISSRKAARSARPAR